MTTMASVIIKADQIGSAAANPQFVTALMKAKSTPTALPHTRPPN